jgi:hypothetical protein
MRRKKRQSSSDSTCAGSMATQSIG